MSGIAALVLLTVCGVCLRPGVLSMAGDFPGGAGGQQDQRRADGEGTVAPAGAPEGSPRAASPGGEPVDRYAATPERLVPFNRTADPYRRFYAAPLVYRGPSRDKAPPARIETVRIGLLAPLEGSTDARAGESLRDGVTLAIEEANASGGYRGVPFELVVKNDQQLWGSSGNTLVQLAYRDAVWALIGSIDSTSTHVALRAALKAELPIVNVGSTDPTMTETGIPWILRTTPDDRQAGYRLVRHLFDERGYHHVAVIRSSDRYGRVGVMEFRDAARRSGHPLPIEILVEPGQTDFRNRLRRVADSEVEAIVLWTRADLAARILAQMRALGMRQPVVGTDRLVSREFLDAAGPLAEGVTAVSWIDTTRDDPAMVRFRVRYRARFDADPDAFGIYGYDAARIVVGAIRETGLNRARLRDALLGLRTYEGVAGPVHFNETANNIDQPLLAHVRGGRFVFE